MYKTVLGYNFENLKIHFWHNFNNIIHNYGSTKAKNSLPPQPI